VLLAVAAGCSDSGVPSPDATTLADGTEVWKIQDAPCPEGSDCGLGVYINRWYYGISCEHPRVPDDALGAVFAVGDPSGPVEPIDVAEARLIAHQSAETLALRLDCPGGDRWISSQGQFDDHGLDDPPADPTQHPPA
jgi:hypothetical protein